ncbi:MAG TPA: 4-hydroxy-tetrahydrodipicolinate reductase [Syntrophales bacterium]|nr:4-hydroxy-tetrahydrodipicolinate reductase [Syntrophales bacterium]HOL58569.1 4-hydroxy-tetrahydrodipicolinate reductase [Syntrophales bacterium]HPO34823.1 4-hydroxy-tetrahydrodipicolinate reductase [Syntrophales bacterium]
MINAVVIGVGGRMGSRIAHWIDQTEGIQIAGGVEGFGHPMVGHDVGEIIGRGRLGVKIVDRLEEVVEKADVIIEFTHHEATISHLIVAAGKGKPMVIGTTGFTAQEMEEIRHYAQRVPLVVAPNMSVGINVLFKVLKDVARILGNDYEVEIVEAHHNQKKDAPSGTALKMAQIIAEVLGRDLERDAIYERKGVIGPRKKNEIGIQTIRGGDIVGEHNVMFVTEGERLEFIHRAHSRDNFARGAVRAALWIVGKPPGLYDMQDVLGLKG